MYHGLTLRKTLVRLACSFGVFFFLLLDYRSTVGHSYQVHTHGLGFSRFEFLGWIFSIRPRDIVLPTSFDLYGRLTAKFAVKTDDGPKPWCRPV